MSLTFKDLQVADHGQCPACHRNMALERHHKKSMARGGSDDYPNIVWLCRGCHRAVHDHNGDWTKRFRTHSWQIEGETEADETN